MLPRRRVVPAFLAVAAVLAVYPGSEMAATPALDPPALDPPALDPPALDPPALDPPALDPPALDAPRADSTVIILLGTGTPFPDPDRQGPATAVVVGERVFLFDAGPGVMRQMNAAGLPRSGPEALFITHLHSDHTLGYPDLILTSWVMRRAGPFPVIGPPGLAVMTEHIMAAWAEDIRIRTDGLEAEVRDGHRVDVREVEPGDGGAPGGSGGPIVVYDSAGVTVTAIPVHHGSWEHAFAYRIDAPDRSVLIAGDLAPPFDALIPAARGVDVLVSEVYPAAHVEPEDRPGGHLWPEYMREFHTSGEELGALAAAVEPQLLLLTHVLWHGATANDIVSAIRRGGYAGPVVVGEDLGRY